MRWVWAIVIGVVITTAGGWVAGLICFFITLFMSAESKEGDL